MNKKAVFISMLLFFVFSVAIGRTYSYYVPNIVGSSSSDSLVMSNKNIEINYVNDSSILIDSTHTNVTKNITIKNNGSPVNYLLNFDDITNSLVDKKKLTYSYTCTGAGCDERSNIQVPNIEETLTLFISIGSGATHTYEITFTYDGTPSGSFTGRISSLAIIPTVYGVTFNNAITGVRTDDAIGLSYTVNTETINSDFDDADIYKDMVDVDNEDTYGNVFVKIPKFYIKKTKSAGNIWTYQISKIKLDSLYYLPECFKRQSTGELLKYVLVGKYDASLNGNKLESKTGIKPQTNKTIADFRSYARNNGPSYQILDIHVIDMIQTLFYIEFATLDSQTVMFGFGFPLATIIRDNGTTDGIGTASGSPRDNLDGLNCMKYRGIENFYGHLWQFTDGVNIWGYQAYVAKNPDNYQSNKFDVEYVQLNYRNDSNSSGINDWITEMGHDSNHPYANFAIATGKTGNSIYKDKNQASKKDLVEREMVFGGSLQNGLGVLGISYWDSASDSNHSSNRVTARLIKKAF